MPTRMQSAALAPRRENEPSDEPASLPQLLHEVFLPQPRPPMSAADCERIFRWFRRALAREAQTEAALRAQAAGVTQLHAAYEAALRDAHDEIGDFDPLCAASRRCAFTWFQEHALRPMAPGENVARCEARMVALEIEGWRGRSDADAGAGPRAVFDDEGRSPEIP